MIMQIYHIPCFLRYLGLTFFFSCCLHALYVHVYVYVSASSCDVYIDDDDGDDVKRKVDNGF